jgi:hypothetical protein
MGSCIRSIINSLPLRFSYYLKKQNVTLDLTLSLPGDLGSKGWTNTMERCFHAVMWPQVGSSINLRALICFGEEVRLQLPILWAV